MAVPSSSFLVRGKKNNAGACTHFYLKSYMDVSKMLLLLLLFANIMCIPMPYLSSQPVLVNILP